MSAEGPRAWSDALAAAALFAVDPAGTGLRLRAPAGPVRERWLEHLRALLPEGLALRRLPPQVDDARLLGGLDLAATLAAGRPVARAGLLAEADGGVLILPMAERLEAGVAARLAAAMDGGEVSAEREGFAFASPARFGVVALDEGLDAEERPPAALLDRLAFAPDLSALAPRDAVGKDVPTGAAITAARLRLARVEAPSDVVEALCVAALALGIGSLRAPLLALRAARTAAALTGRDAVGPEDAVLAARLVLAPRATALPQEPSEEAAAEAPRPEEREDQGGEGGEGEGALAETVLAAARAALPPELLASLQQAAARSGPRSQGRAGAVSVGSLRGRPFGTRRGLPRNGARLALLESLRAAAPWQRLRGAEPGRIALRADDLRVRRFSERRRTTTIFVVDASGSAAFHRLAEAKGAVELLLADCYVRRDQVALVAFRGRGAELLLPPTRSLARAKRSLAALPGGGGTPLAAGLDAAGALAEAARRRGETPSVVLLTDGRANVARDGIVRRAEAEAEALQAARQLAGRGAASLLIDTSPQPRREGRALAEAMGARYVPLPQADAAALSRAVRAGSP